MKGKRKTWLSGEIARRMMALFLMITLVVVSTPVALAAEADGGGQVTSPEETVYVNSYSGDERKINFNDHWRFFYGEQSGAQSPDFNDASWKNIDLPHDYSIEQSYTTSGEAESGYLPGGVGWYRKIFSVDPSWKTTKRLSILFDGVYMNAEVYLNGTKLGDHPYGYTPFSFELPADLLRAGENVLAVKVNNPIPSSRWYSGSGIYRDVSLVVTNPVHVAPYGVTVTTPNHGTQTESGRVDIEAVIANDSTTTAERLTVVNTILEKKTQTVVATTTTPVTVPSVGAKGEQKITDSIVVQSPKQWNVWDKGEANLYTVKTEIKQGDQILDTVESDFGFRYFGFDNDNGFSLNGEKMKLRGVCMHHDQGALGAEAWEDAIRRQVKILKEMGCNSIRVTHNPAARILLDVCNEEGMLVVEEVFDTWSNAKNSNSNDFSKHFNQKIGSNPIEGGSSDMTWAEFDIKAMVQRGKNDPSIIMWSLGNEIFEGISGDSSNYPQIAENLIHWVGEVDHSRYVTIGDNKRQTSGNGTPYQVMTKIHEANQPNSGVKGGVIGFNYGKGGEIPSGHKNGWLMYGSETASAVNSRGVYDYKEDSNTNAPNQMLTSYDKSSVGWGAVASDAWMRTIQDDFNAGEFIWTGFDYIGEPTPWNGTGSGVSPYVPGRKFENAPKSSYFGIIDTTGFPKDSYYLYQSLWNDKVSTLHLLPTWDERDVIKDSSGKVEVVVYSDAPVIRLYLNDKEIGAAKSVQQTSKQGGYHYNIYKSCALQNNGANSFSAASGHQEFYATFQVPWAQGKLEVKAFADEASTTPIADTKGRNVVHSTAGAQQLRLTAEQPTVIADGTSLSYVTIDVTDNAGNIVNSADPEIKVQVTGNGKLVGMDNGRQVDHTSYQSDTWKASRGKLLAIVQSTQDAGAFTVTASSGSMRGSTTVKTVEDPNASKEKKPLSVTYVRNYCVKKGMEPQLPSSIKVTFTDGSNQEIPVQWDRAGLNVQQTGTTAISGTLLLDNGSSLGINANITVIDTVAALRNYSAAALKGSSDANLPAALPAIMPDGEISKASFPVNWNTDGLDLNVAGTYQVTGTANVFGQELTPVATIRVSEGQIDLGGNVVGAAYLHIDGGDRVTDNSLAMIRDQKKGANDAAWKSQGSLSFEYDTAQNLVKAVFAFKGDQTPQFTLSSSGDGKQWASLTAKMDSATADGVTTVTCTFDMVSAVWLKMDFQSAAELLETELYVGTPNFHIGSEAALKRLEVGSYKASAGILENGVFNVPMAATADQIIVEGKDNASVTVLPAVDNVVRVIMESEDHIETGTYIINLNNFDGNHIQNADQTGFDYDIKKITASAPSVENRPGNEGPVELALDNNDSTWYHSAWGENLSNDAGKRYIQLELQEAKRLNALRYLPRADLANGVITEYRIEVSEDTQDWTKVAEGKWERSAGWKLAHFDESKLAKYVRLYGVTTAGDYANKFLSAAELRVCVDELDGPAVISGFQETRVETKVGIAPVMPTTVIAKLSDGSSIEKPVVWPEIRQEQYAEANSFTLEGTVDGTSLKPRAHVLVEGVVSVETIPLIVVSEGMIPQLPTHVNAEMASGITQSLEVSWDTIPQLKQGDTVTVKGRIPSYNDYPVSVQITVVEMTDSDQNLALNPNQTGLPMAIALYSEKKGNPYRATDGNISWDKDNNSGKKDTWCDWEQNKYHDETPNWMGVVFGSDDTVKTQIVNCVKVGFLKESDGPNSIGLPRSYEVEYYTGPSDISLIADKNGAVREWPEDNPLKDDQNWTPVNYIGSKPTPADNNALMEVRFDPVVTSAVRIKMHANTQQWLAIPAFEVYGANVAENTERETKVEVIAPKAAKPQDVIDIQAKISLVDSISGMAYLLAEAVDGESVCYVNGTEVGRMHVSGPATVTFSQINVTEENGFQEGENIIKVAYGGNKDGIIELKPAEGSTSMRVTLNLTHTVTFNANGGTLTGAETIQVEEGQVAVKPSDPVRENYDFAGWYTEETCENEYLFTEAVTSDLTLYAKWKEKTALTGVTITPETLTLDVGESGKLTASLHPAGAEGDIVWSVYPDDGTISIDQNGMVIAKQEGEVTVQATVGDYSAQSIVTVYKSSSGGSSGSDNSQTVINPDGSTTTIKTDHKGTVTETTKKKDGSVEIVETSKDGVVKKTRKDPMGTTGTVVTNRDGRVTEIYAEVSQQSADLAERENQPVRLPVETEMYLNSSAAPVIQLDVPDGGTKVEMPVKNLTAGTVAILVHADGSETILKKSVASDTGIIINLSGDSDIKLVDNSKHFEDVRDGYWAKSAVDFATSRELFNGVSDTQFAPSAPTTRGQLMTVLARLDDADTQGNSIQKGIEWAVQKGISDGSNPEDTMTRQELATMLWRYAGMPQSDYVFEHSDSDQISDYAKAAMSWALESGILTGYVDGSLKPSDTASRAQVAVMMERFVRVV